MLRINNLDFKEQNDQALLREHRHCAIIDANGQLYKQTNRRQYMTNSLSLRVLPERLAVCRLASDAPLPAPGTCTCFWSVTRTEEELSVVLPEDMAPSNCQVEAGWRCLKVIGPLDLSLTGILASLATSLAEAGIPIFAISTYDTDYILVKEENLERAAQALQKGGHTVIGTL